MSVLGKVVSAASTWRGFSLLCSRVWHVSVSVRVIACMCARVCMCVSAYECICVRCLCVVHGAFRIVKETILSAQFLLLFALRLRVVIFVCVWVY